jgi:predicted RNase H-like HicB family nuclease
MLFVACTIFVERIKKEVFPMDINITIEVWQKGKWFIAKCPELDFISQGKTREEAKKNLLEVIQIQFEEMSQIGALDQPFKGSTFNWFNQS